jgi:coenzyme F420 hydrogenase subunit beta
MKRDVGGIYTPDIDEARCSRCMICTEACPAMPARGMEAFAAGHMSGADVMGPCLESYVGYSADSSLRYNAASGGIVTALLLNAFERETIDVVLAVMSSKDSPFESSAEIIKNRESISGSAGSRYLPVEYSKALKQLIYDNSLKSAGIVGLPCHIDGIKRACLKVPKLRKKIAFTIALFCKQTKDLRFTDMVLAKIGVEKENVKEIRFRGGGWPGLIQIITWDGSIIRYPYEEFNALWGTFSCTPVSCLLCTTPMGEDADISVGDAWLDKYSGDKLGVSAAFVRTGTGREIVDQAVKDKRIELEGLNPDALLDVQPRLAVMVKKDNFANRLKMLGLFDREVAGLCLGVHLSVKRLLRSLEFLWVLVIRYITSSVIFRKGFPFFPRLILKILSRGTAEVLKVLSKLAMR